jgi:two-component system copper resistance phosphate regulon response regulator CusR
MNADSSGIHSGFIPSCYHPGTNMTESLQEPTRYVYGTIILDRLRRKVTAAGLPVELTTQEFVFLELFLAHAGQALSRKQISESIWETDAGPDTNLIDVYVLRLRKKLAAVSPDGPRIHTIRGVGYMLD